MIYLVSFKTPTGIFGHKHVFMEKWQSGDDTKKVMEIIASVHGFQEDEIIIVSVFKLPDQ